MGSNITDLELQKFDESDKYPKSTIRNKLTDKDGNLISSANPTKVALFPNINDFETVGDIDYTGKNPNNFWIITKVDNSAGSIRMATINNNSSTTTYSNAWTNRATLNYGYAQDVY